MALLSPIFNSEFYAAWVEAIAQEVDVFNEKSNMTITMGTELYMGHYFREAGYDRVADLISRRDVDSTADATSLTPSLIEIVGVDLAGKIGPVIETDENFKRRGRSLAEFGAVIGKQAAEDFLQRALDQVVMGLIGTTEVDTALYNTDLNTSTANVKHLLKGQRVFGDKGRNVAAYLMNSAAFYDLVEDQTDNYQMDNVAGVIIVNGVSQGALGRPIIVTDVDNLSFTDTSDYNRIFALTTAAASVEQRGEVTMEMDRKIELENSSTVIKGEYNYLLKMKGYAWDTTAGYNPTDATLSASTSWSRVIDSKLCGAAQIVALAS